MSASSPFGDSAVVLSQEIVRTLVLLVCLHLAERDRALLSSVAASMLGPEELQAFRASANSMAFVDIDRRPLVASVLDKLPAPQSRVHAMGLLIRGIILGSPKSGYDARMRVALRLVAKDLRLNWNSDIVPCERSVALLLRRPQPVAAATSDAGWTAERVAYVGGASILGGIALAVTGGLAAPAVGAVLGTLGSALGVGGGAVSAFLATGSGAVLVSTLFGAGGAGLSAYKMTRRTAALEEFFVLPVQADTTRLPGSELSVTMGISGWLADEEPGRLARFWGAVFARVPGSDRLVVVYDRRELVEYGDSLDSLIANQALGALYKETAKHALGAAIVGAFTLPVTVLQAISLVDNPFGIAKARSQAAGVELANALDSDHHGHRPVTLVGFGFGALAIFVCLETLGRRGKRGVVENVFLMVTPAMIASERWRVAKSVVAGSLVNMFCEDDLVLQLIFRFRDPAGVCRVVADGVENFSIAYTHFQLGEDPARVAQVLDDYAAAERGQVG